MPRSLTRESISVGLLGDQDFIKSLAAFLHELKIDPNCATTNPDGSPGRLAAEQILRATGQSAIAFRTHESIINWLAPQLVNLVPQTDEHTSPFTQEDVGLLAQGLLINLGRGLLNMEPLQPYKTSQRIFHGWTD